MIYYDDNHRQAFKTAVEKRGDYKPVDSYDVSLLYLLTATEPTRANLSRMYNFITGEIEPETINEGFQTGTSVRLSRLAFNLFNGYVEEAQSKMYSPYYLFDASIKEIMLQAIQLRYTPYYDPFLRREEDKNCDKTAKQL